MILSKRTPDGKHEAQTCRLCEAVHPDQLRRHWKAEPKASRWHLMADGPDLMARLPKMAHFATVLAYTPITDVGRHYGGALYFEFDADDIDQALEDLRRCVELLQLEYELPP